MAGDGEQGTDDFRFLFREDKGRIGRETWHRHALRIVALLIPLYAIWLLLAPYTFHDLSKSAFFQPMTALAYAYAIFFAFALIFLTISYVNLSTKRFRALGRPSPLGLASLAPIAAFLSGAAHWFARLVEGVVPLWQAYPFDAAFVVIAGWTIWELGFKESSQ
jgi:uncharacterized membrane protein YhaH (DUF805 family)